MSTPEHPPEVAFRAAYETSYADVVRFAARRVHPSYAEDVAHDVFLVAWRRWGEAPRGEALRPWLFGIARNVLRGERRGEARRGALGVRVAEEVSRTVRPGESDLVGLRVDLARAFARLPEHHQEALALTVWDGLTAAQAATVLDISPVAYRLRLSRARRALRMLADHLPAVTGAAATERTTP